jgi:DNA-directed RNA polymerase specialized sigma subunit
MSFYYDDGFKLFTQVLETRLENQPAYTEEDLARHQRPQIKQLVALEKKFRKTLLAHKSGPTIYKEFVEMICVEKGNILSARPYFRERQEVFTEFISTALKKGSASGIYRFRVNWMFIAWVLKQRNWRPMSEVRLISNEIYKIRKALLEENLPLAISQARTFFGSTPRSHMEFMDIVQVQCQGLLLAIDKFCPPSDEKSMTDDESLDAYRSFRAVAIGIMSRDRVNDYSQTLIHYYPRDRQKIYWANKMLRQFVDEINHEIIADEINLNLKESEKTNPEEIADLLATATTVSADYASEPEGDTVVESAVGDEALRPDIVAENNDLHEQLANAVTGLTLFEKKILKLQGVTYD